jgi:hypothetical protein
LILILFFSKGAAFCALSYLSALRVNPGSTWLASLLASAKISLLLVGE